MICNTSTCNAKFKVKEVFLINPKDFVTDENGKFMRVKRKYGKFNREILRLGKK